MDKRALMQQLRQTFAQELGEGLQVLGDTLLALEKAGASTSDGSALVQKAMRQAHGLKGASSSASLPTLVKIWHAFEELLTHPHALDARGFALLFATVDAAQIACTQLKEGQPLDETLTTAVVAELESAIGAATQGGAGVAVVATSVAETAPAPTAARASLRVDAEKLDALLSGSGELLVARRRLSGWTEGVHALQARLGKLSADWAGVDPRSFARGGKGRPAALAARTATELAALHQELSNQLAAAEPSRELLEIAADHLADQIRRLRMLPFSQACQGLDRVVRDVAVEQHKRVELVVSGGEVELDRSVLEALKDPLRHLVRNAVDHGVEPAATREAAGKPSEARIEIAAQLKGDRVEIRVGDDGAGIDPDAIRAEAARRGWAIPAGDTEVAQMLFRPGFSTASKLTTVSGRGVGLDVVKSQLESIHGAVTVASQRGAGTRFVLVVPLTLTVIRMLLVRCQGHVYAIPSASVRKLMRVSPSDLKDIGQGIFVTVDGRPVEVAALRELLRLPKRAPGAPQAKTPAVVLGTEDRQRVVLVDELIAEQEVMLKGLGERIKRLRCVAGATILPTGAVALALNAAELVDASTRGEAVQIARRPLGRDPSAKKRRLLVVDDSATTRAFEKGMLEAAGFEVRVATDGAQAWQVLQEDEGLELVISDAEMPRMNGFELTETIRRSDRFKNLPVVICTSLGSEKDKAMGVSAGADGYIVKSQFDEASLLELVQQLLGEAA